MPSDYQASAQEASYLTQVVNPPPAFQGVYDPGTYTTLLIVDEGQGFVGALDFFGFLGPGDGERNEIAKRLVQAGAGLASSAGASGIDVVSSWEWAELGGGQTAYFLVWEAVSPVGLLDVNAFFKPQALEVFGGQERLYLIAETPGFTPQGSTITFDDTAVLGEIPFGPLAGLSMLGFDIPGTTSIPVEVEKETLQDLVETLEPIEDIGDAALDAAENTAKAAAKVAEAVSTPFGLTTVAIVAVGAGALWLFGPSAFRNLLPSRS